MEATRNIEILLDDLIHDQTSIEITIPTALAFIDSQQQKIKKLEEEKAKLLIEISLKNINLIEVEKENNKLEEEKEEFIIYEDKQSSVISKYYGKTLVQENDITKLKQQAKEMDEIIKEAINLPKGVEPHSYSDYLNKNK